MKKKRILVAGGSGLLGSNITKLLIDSKANIVSSFNSKYQNKKKKIIKNLIFLILKTVLKQPKIKMLYTLLLLREVVFLI